MARKTHYENKSSEDKYRSKSRLLLQGVVVAFTFLTFSYGLVGDRK